MPIDEELPSNSIELVDTERKLQLSSHKQIENKYGSDIQMSSSRDLEVKQLHQPKPDSGNGRHLPDELN